MRSLRVAGAKVMEEPIAKEAVHVGQERRDLVNVGVVSFVYRATGTTRTFIAIPAQSAALITPRGVEAACSLSKKARTRSNDSGSSHPVRDRTYCASCSAVVTVVAAPIILPASSDARSARFILNSSANPFP